MNEMENIMTDMTTTIVPENSHSIPVLVVTKAEYDALKAVAENTQAELDNYKALHKSAIELANTHRNRADSFKEEIKQFIVDNLGGHVDDDDLRNLAESFEIDLMQNVSFTATVEFTVTANVPLGIDLDELRDMLSGDFNASLDYNGSEIEDIDIDYHDVELSEIEVY